LEFVVVEEGVEFIVILVVVFQEGSHWIIDVSVELGESIDKFLLSQFVRP
jgi:hypothetical protein